MPVVSFHVTREETLLINRILDRAEKLTGEKVSRMDAHMDLAAVHANGCKMKFQEMLDGPEYDFLHDFYGIRRHIDRKTGALKDCFLPRFAAPENEN